MSKFSNGTASAQIKSGVGSVSGVIVNSHSSGTFRFNDGLSGTTSAGVKATQTLTASGTFSNGETFLVGDVTYTMLTALTNLVANEILIGVSAAVSLDNIKSAINNSAGEGTTYSTGTVANPNVTATTNAATTQVVEAYRVGTYGNAIITTEACANAAWGAGTLASGAEASLLMTNTHTLTVAGSQVISFPEALEFTAGLYLTVGGTLDYTVVYNY